MEAETEVRAADNPGVVLRLEPSRSELNAAGRQTGEATLELRPTIAVAGNEHDEIWKAPFAVAGFPGADAILEITGRLDHQVEIFICGPAGGAYHESERRSIADAESYEERLANLFAFETLNRREARRGAIVEHAHRMFAAVLQLDPFGQKPRETA